MERQEQIDGKMERWKDKNKLMERWKDKNKLIERKEQFDGKKRRKCNNDTYAIMKGPNKRSNLKKERERKREREI